MHSCALCSAFMGDARRHSAIPFLAVCGVVINLSLPRYTILSPRLLLYLVHLHCMLYLIKYVVAARLWLAYDTHINNIA